MKKTTLPLAFSLLLFASTLFAQPGLIDNSFGTNGKVNTSIGTGGGEVWAMAVQDDWSIVVGGFEMNGVDSDFAIMRYTPNGTIDSTFGTNGKVTTAMGPGNDVIYSIALQPDGKIVAAGIAWNGTDYDMAMARYTSGGVLDNSFGVNGKVITPLGLADDIGVSIKIQPDWAIVLGGTTFSGSDRDFAILRYKTNGTLDSTFGNNGKVITPIGAADDDLSALAIQTDSSIVVAGTVHNGSASNFGLARYLKNGTLDNTFGTNGKVITASTLNDDEAYSIALQTDGKIVVGGYSGNGVNDDFGLVRYNTNGSLDNGFGTNGIVTTAIGDSSEAIYSMTIQPDGKIIGAGSSINAGIDQYALARYNSDGSLDNTFGTNGQVTTVMSAGNNEAYAVALQPDGKIVAAGYANTGTNDEFSLVRYLSGLSLGVLDFSVSNNALFIYPNPVAQNAVLQYTLTNNEPITIRLIDMQGRIVKTFINNQAQGAGEHKLPLLLSDNLAAGSYLINLSSPSGQMNIKIVKAW